jgi:hypothetical protein
MGQLSKLSPGFFITFSYFGFDLGMMQVELYIWHTFAMFV